MTWIRSCLDESQGFLSGCDCLDRGGKLKAFRSVSGSSSAVERQLPKLDVAGSIPVSRSILPIVRKSPKFVLHLDSNCMTLGVSHEKTKSSGKSQ
jgi:hypothetical protein